MKIQKFNFLIESLDPDKLEHKKQDLINILDEYKDYMIDNYDKINSIEASGITEQISMIIGEDIVEYFNLFDFLRKMDQLLILNKNKKISKSNIDEEFLKYYNSLNKRIQNLQKDVKINYFDEFIEDESDKTIIPKKLYNKEKYELQVELLKLEEWVIKNNKRIAIIFEGRDAAGKGSTIKKFIEYLNPNGFKIVKLGKPTEQESNDWFKRYEDNMPEGGQICFFDRSWYNRAVVEPVMGYCTEDQYKKFMNKVNEWEKNLVDSGIILIKFWFSISQEKQLLRFNIRKKSPLKYWKYSPNDEATLSKWDVISLYKNQMFNKTSSEFAPWVIINSNDKKIGHLNAMRYVLSLFPYENKNEEVCKYYPEVVTILK